MRSGWKILIAMLTFCLVLPLLAATLVYAEDDCDGTPDQLQIKGGEDADHDGVPDLLRTRTSCPVAKATSTLSTTCGGTPDRLRIQGGAGASQDRTSDRLQIGK